MGLQKIRINKILQSVTVTLALSGFLYSCQSAENVKKYDKTEKTVVKKDSVKTNATASATVKSEQKKLVVYYFHTTYRCQSCNMIEKFTREAVETGFPGELKNGEMELKVINIEEPGNEHFANDYKLYTKSVIVSGQKDGKEVSWKNLDKVWTLLGDQNKFIEYIQAEIKTSLKG